MNDQFNGNRQNISNAWNAVKTGETLEGENARLAAILQEHQEYQDVWDNLDTYVAPTPDTGEVNPIVHVYFHLIVENQIELRQPREVVQAIERMVRNGRDRHDAIHAVASLLADEIFTTLRKHMPFNQARYVRHIQKLR